MDVPEAELVHRLRAGDAVAFRGLVQRHHGAMLRVARALVGDGAEDIAQETWAAVLDGLDRFEEKSSIKTWMFRILTNRAKSWLERRKRDGVGAELEREAAEEEPAVDPARFSRIGSWASPPLGWEAQTPEALLSRLEEGAALRRAVDALPAAQRLVVTLRDLEGLDAAEVCEMLDVSEANQRVLLHRGRSKIRTFIEAQEQRRRTSR